MESECKVRFQIVDFRLQNIKPSNQIDFANRNLQSKSAFRQHLILTSDFCILNSDFCFFLLHFIFPSFPETSATAGRRSPHKC